MATRGAFGELTDPENFQKNALRKTGLQHSGAYYEVNSHLKWDEIAVKKYHAFDTLAPNGVHEMKIPAKRSGPGDAACSPAAGTVDFGTMRLATAVMARIPGAAAGFSMAVPGTGDPVSVRSRREGKTCGFNAVNRTPDRCTFKSRGPARPERR